MLPVMSDHRNSNAASLPAAGAASSPCARPRRSMPPLPQLHRSSSASSVHSTVSFLSDASTATPISPTSAHSVWFSATTPYPRMLLLLLVLSFTFTFGFCLSSRLSCALGHFVIGKLKPGAEPRALAVLATCVTILVPANFIAVFIFHFAKAQPGAEVSECDLTRPSGWLLLAKRLCSEAVRLVIPNRCLRREDGSVQSTTGSINETTDPITPPSSPSFTLRSIPRSLLLSLTALLSFLFTAHTPIGLWLRNGCLDTLSTLLTLFPDYLHNAFDVQHWYSADVQQLMQRLLGDQWVAEVDYGMMMLNLTRTLVLLPVWYRNVPWRQQLSIDGTPLCHTTHDVQCELCVQEQLDGMEADDKQQSHAVGCETTSNAASLNVSPLPLARTLPSIVRCSSIADTASPYPSPRSDLSTEFDCASSIALDEWQLDEVRPPSSNAVDIDCTMPPSLSFSSVSSSTSTVPATLSGGSSVMWLFLVSIGAVWLLFLFLSTDLHFFGVQYMAMFLVPISAWTNTHPTLILCLCFTTLALFLVIDHVRHSRHSHHQQLAFTAEGCSCRTSYLLLLCVLVSLDSIYYFIVTPFSSIISHSYLALDSSLHERALSVLSFYALMLVWQLIVRYVAMHALPRGSSLAVLFPIMLVEDVWADLIFTSFTPFSLSFFFISLLHLIKTFVRDFDLLPSLLLYLPTLVASPSTASLRACLTQTSSWRLAFPRRVLRHQNVVTELCAKVVVVAVLCGDMVGEGVLGPPMMLMDPTVPFNGVYWDAQRRQRGMIVGALLFLMLQQCIVHAAVLRMLGWIDDMDQANKEQDEQQAAPLDHADLHPTDDAFTSATEAAVEAVYDSCDSVHSAERGDYDDCHVSYRTADDEQPWVAAGEPSLPRSSSSVSSLAVESVSSASSSDGIVWLDRHWRFHFLFFVCCIVRLVSVMLSMVSENLHNVYYDNRLMCSYIRWMAEIGYQGSV